MRIDVLIENSTHSELKCEHGLSFLIHYNNKSYLLDSGQSGAFMDNAKTLGFDLNLVDKCILSHGHYDHSDGFLRFIGEYPDKKIYASKDVFDEYYSSSHHPLHYIGLDKRLNREHFHLIDQMTCIDEGVYLIPHHQTLYTVNKNLYRKINDEFVLDDFTHELSLVFVNGNELVVFNSCSHVGMVSIVEDMKQYFPDKSIKAYFGGLHMKGKDNGNEICVYSDEEISLMSEMIKKEGINVYTGHCTGMIGYNKLKAYCDVFISPIYSGFHIEF